MTRLLVGLLAVMGIVGAIWLVLHLTGIELALVPTLVVAMLLTTVLHLTLNRPRWRT